MAGQLGNVKNTIQNLVIVKIFTEDNIILVKGSIPGHDGSNVIIKHTQKKYTLKEILTKDGELQEEIKEVKKSAKKEAKEAKEDLDSKEHQEEVREHAEVKQTTEKNLPDTENKDKE
jgi:hypothetical protein